MHLDNLEIHIVSQIKVREEYKVKEIFRIKSLWNKETWVDFQKSQKPFADWKMLLLLLVWHHKKSTILENSKSVLSFNTKRKNYWLDEIILKITFYQEHNFHIILYFPETTQNCTDVNDYKGFCRTLKVVYGPIYHEWISTLNWQRLYFKWLVRILSHTCTTYFKCLNFIASHKNQQ